MLFDSFFRYLDSHRPRTRARHLRRRVVRPVPPRLFLEHLEDRALPSFLTAPQYPAGGPFPSSVAMADPDRDGHADLVVVNSASSTVSVLRNRGDGTFAAPTSYPAGSSPSRVAVGDFNGDGWPDLAVTNIRIDGTVSVLRNRGDGTFAAPTSYPVGQWATVVAAADLDGDGDLDLAVGNAPFPATSTVSVLRNRGDGTFAAATSYLVGPNLYSLAVGDLDGDQDLDLVANSYVLRNQGDGTFGPPTGHRGDGFVMGDVDGDGDLDLVGFDAIDGVVGVSVLRNRGDGTFAAATIYPDGPDPSFVVVGDLDGDQDLDVAVAHGGTNRVSVLRNRGDGTFAAAVSYGVGPIPSSVAVGELDGDQNLDLAVANSNHGDWTGPMTVSVLRNRGDGTFPAPTTQLVGINPRSVAVGDVDGDQDLDLAVANYGSDTVSVLRNMGGGIFATATSYAVGNYPTSVALGDLDGDGDLDLVVANAGPGTVSLLRNMGDGTFAAAVSYAVGSTPYSVAVGDLDGDNDLDLAVANANSGTVSVLRNRGDGTFAAAMSYPAATGPYSVAVGDLDGDRDLDLAVAHWLGGVAVLRNHGDGTFAAPVIYFAGYNSVAAGDLDGDLDLAVADDDDIPGTVSVLRNRGDGTFDAATSYSAGPNAISVAVGDVDGDGDLDLAVANRTAPGGTVSVLRNQGDGTFAAPTSYSAGIYCSSVALGDFNGDAYPDLAVTSFQTIGIVNVLLNAADDAAFFYLDAPAAVPAGQPFDLTVYALSGDWQRLAHGYRGTVAFWSTDEAATLPEPYTFRPEDGGIASFPGGVTLRTPGTQYLVAFDLETFTVIGYAVVEVLGRGGGGGAPFGAADFALAQAGLDLVTWTRPRNSAAIAAGTASPVRG